MVLQWIWCSNVKDCKVHLLCTFHSAYYNIMLPPMLFKYFINEADDINSLKQLTEARHQRTIENRAVRKL